ncbi:MAG: phosphatase PAP2 family protein [Cellulosilyticum sp.]|nr:phosphatase PAP2 family protein [Cellulosilyticum sp.]
MKKKNQNQRSLWIMLVALFMFVAWTLALTKVDLQPVGPEGTVVGFATINSAFHEWTGVHMWLYEMTDWLGLVPIIVVLGFGVLGLTQLIKRRSLFKVDSDILILGVFYILVMAAYVIFEMFVINYRPVLIEGRLEASYPSSTTLLVLCVMPTAIMQLNNRIKNVVLRKVTVVSISLFIVFMVVGRLVSGVHWLTDIVGGVLLSIGLVMLYQTMATRFRKTI